MQERGALFDVVQRMLTGLQGFNSATAAALARRDVLGEYNFDDLVPEFEAVFSLCRNIPFQVLRDLSTGQLDKLRKGLEKAHAAIDAVRKFNLGASGDLHQRHLDITNEIQGSLDEAADIIMPYASYGMGRSLDIEGTEKKVRASIERMDALVNEFQQKMESKGKEMVKMSAEIGEDLRKKADERLQEFRTHVDSQAQEVREHMRRAANLGDSVLPDLEKKVEGLRSGVTNMSVGGQADYFRQESEKHTKSSVWWGIGALAFAMLLVLYALFGEKWIPVNLTGTDDLARHYALAQAVISRILVFAVLGYALFFCVKNYTAHRHNAIVNRHRQNALMTYRALVEANDTPENADIVLGQAARCIFAPQDSGYARSGSEDGAGVSVFETFRRAANAAKKGDD